MMIKLTLVEEPESSTPLMLKSNIRHSCEPIPFNSNFFSLPGSHFQQTSPSKCRIWGSHVSGYEELYLLGYNAVLCIPPALHLFLAWLILWPWRWRRLLPPKRLLTFNRLLVLYPRRQNSSPPKVCMHSLCLSFKPEAQPNTSSWISLGDIYRLQVVM
jgi:hypothetical protein